VWLRDLAGLSKHHRWRLGCLQFIDLALQLRLAHIMRLPETVRVLEAIRKHLRAGRLIAWEAVSGHNRAPRVRACGRRLVNRLGMLTPYRRPILALTQF
jgi:hypothetical protein